jgi:resuscitation-promoting factor RpfB
MGKRKPTLFSFLLFSCLVWLVCGLLLSACTTSTPSQGVLSIAIKADGKQVSVDVPAGSTAQLALDKAGITLGSLDRVDPPVYTLLTGAATIQVTRVREVFEVEETVLPFSRQVVKNESLPTNQTMIVQAGTTGLLQITYRRVFENEIEVSRTRIKSQTVNEPQAEIEMVGVQSPFTPSAIPNKLAYLTTGSAWLMERTTAERRPLVTSGDLDGYVFSLSPDGKWLLYSRKSSQPVAQEINNLFVISTVDDNAQPIDLKTKNVVHFAAWAPGGTNQIYYSTVEPRSSAPGWQANNDLNALTFSNSGGYIKRDEVIGANSGGVYGWWGTTYAFSADGKALAYARPDSIGIVNLDKKTTTPLLDLLPYQTRSGWAWVPGLAWSADHRVLYAINHLPQTGVASKENSQIFDLAAFIPETNQSTDLTSQVGMFSYPAVSPLLPGNRSWIAFLKAYFPDQSETSRYRLYIMDRDGSNQHSLFPEEGAAGLDPQQVVWSPAGTADPATWLAVIYKGNLYLINPVNGKANQVTGDGLIKRVDWK